MPRKAPTACKRSAVDAAQAAYEADGRPTPGRAVALPMVIAAYGVGGGGMLAWLGFLLMGPPVLVPLRLSTIGSLLFDALLCLVFFVQHSVMVRRRFRLWMTRRLDAAFHGTLYAAASGGCLLLLVGLWQPVESIVWDPSAPVRWVSCAVFAAAAAGGWWGSRALGEFDALGVKPAMQAADKSRPAAAPTFVVRGPYRWVRHPLYLSSLILIWAGPVFTIDRLLHNLSWTIWIVFGTIMEERDLVDCFGKAYRRYQRRVPMLLPRSLKPLIAGD